MNQNDVLWDKKAIFLVDSLMEGRRRIDIALICGIEDVLLSLTLEDRMLLVSFTKWDRK